MFELKLPDKFMNLKCLYMMMLILFPKIAKKQRESKGFCGELEIYFPEIRICCYEIFKENNIKKRSSFFSNPLIKHLWSIFITTKPRTCVTHLRRIRSYPYEGEARF